MFNDHVLRVISNIGTDITGNPPISSSSTSGSTSSSNATLNVSDLRNVGRIAMHMTEDKGRISGIDHSRVLRQHLGGDMRPMIVFEVYHLSGDANADVGFLIGATVKFGDSPE
ncbi:hypothetical protein FRB94_014692 [Tulasnella sp. JGI-2019a]|nr:hypothetical protein FRB94_014692 [Tulasnella sp. JGI-2019a]